MSQNIVFDADLAKRHPINILLVDDNAINLKVASRMLLRMGYEVDQAENGLQAVEAQTRTGYDLIFMDIQMPEMDGVTATKTIIKNFSPEERPRIVAVTAHAMKGDRERYLEAGMDGYISKPVRVEKLIAAIQETPCKTPVAMAALAGIEDANTAAAESAAPAAAAAELPVDIAMFGEMLGMEPEDAEEMLPELVELFLDDSAEQLASIETAVNSGDLDLLRNAAHKMKGGSASVAAVPLSKVCGKLEKMAIEGSLDGAPEQVTEAKAEFTRLQTWFNNQ